MVFYVYMDPDIFSIDSSGNNYELLMNILIGILRGFTQNCCLAEFENYRIQDSIKEKINELPDSFERKKIKKLLAKLAKRNRFIYCLVPDYSEEKEDVLSVSEQASNCFLDLLLLKELQNNIKFPDDIEIKTIENYIGSDFEEERSELSNNGRVFKTGEFSESEFLDRCFMKMMRHSSKIEIYDKMFGSKFGDNFKYTIKIFLRWFETVIAEPENCEFIFHCQKPRGKTDDYIRMELASFKTGRLKNLKKMEIQFYEFMNGSQVLPHDRYIVTDQFAIDFGRGLDFLDKKTKRNRDLTMSNKDFKEVEDLLKSYSSATIQQRISI